MQTFLPYPDFIQSAKCLDNKRLGKQRVEVLQLLLGQYKNHPASKMWRNHEWQLAEYGLVICDEWISRGFKDTCKTKILEEQAKYTKTGLPSWFGGPIHENHQSRLLQKDPEFYREVFGSELIETTINYWPIN